MGEEGDREDGGCDLERPALTGPKGLIRESNPWKSHEWGFFVFSWSNCELSTTCLSIGYLLCSCNWNGALLGSPPWLSSRNIWFLYRRYWYSALRCDMPRWCASPQLIYPGDRYRYFDSAHWPWPQAVDRSVQCKTDHTRRGCFALLVSSTLGHPWPAEGSWKFFRRKANRPSV